MSIRRRRSLCSELLSTQSSCPPPKPPRGFLRSEPVRIEPLRRITSDDNHPQLTSSPVVSPCAFSTAKKYQEMKDYFRRAVQEREDGVFSGFDALNILDVYLQANRKQFSVSSITKENALKVLDIWLRENVIRPVNTSTKDSAPFFRGSKKVMYTMNPDNDHKLYICATPLHNSKQVERRPSRTSSFKRFFSPSRTKHAEENTALCNASTGRSLFTNNTRSPVVEQPSRFSSILNFSSHHLNTESRSIQEEAELHDAALFRLLTIVDIPMLDDLIAVPGQPTKSASILSSILSKIGLRGATPETIASKDDEMDDLLNSAPCIRPLLPWFQLARICAPNLYFKSSGKPNRTEIHNWGKLALQAVSERYSLITHRGSSPLIPTEFSPILDAIMKQLLDKKEEKTGLALQYLYLMIPQQLRNHLSNVLQFLERTLGTDVFMSLRSPYYLGKKGDNENFEVVLNELRCFIFPQTVEKSDQNRLVESLIELRKRGSLGKQPEELLADLRTLRANEGKETMPIRFCQAESSVKNFDADAEVASTLIAVIDDSQISLAEKQRKCELFKQHHPKIYRKYFAHLSW